MGQETSPKPERAAESREPDAEFRAGARREPPSGGLLGALNAERFDPIAERRRSNAEQLGGAALAGDSPFGLLERANQVVALEIA